MHQQIFKIYRHLPVSRACCKISSGRPATAFPSVPRSLQRCARWSIVVGGVPKKRTNKTIKNGQTCQVCQLSKRVRIVNQDVFYHLGPFLARVDLFGQFQTKNYFLLKAHPPNPTLSLWGNKLIFVWNCPKVTRWAQKGPKLSKPSRFTILDPFGPLWTTLECWQAWHVCLFYWCDFLGHRVKNT